MNHHDKHDSHGIPDMDAVSRAYRDAQISQDEKAMLPPAALDDAIRAAARRAVHAGPQPVGMSGLRRWTPQLAVAAVIVLSVSVVLVTVLERPELAPAPVQIALNRPAEAPAAPALPMQTRIVDAGPTVQAVPQADIAADALKKQRVADAGVAAGNVQVTPRAEALRTKEAGRNGAPMVPPPAQPAAAAPAPAAPVFAPAPFPASVAEAVAPARQEAKAEASAGVVQKAKLIEEKVAVAARSRGDYETAARSASSAAPAAAVQAPTPKPLAPSAVAAAPPRATLSDTAHGNTQASGTAGSSGLVKDENQPSGKSDVDQRPGPWLKRLLELREQGKMKALREELVRFRKAHPDVVLPKALTQLPVE